MLDRDEWRETSSHPLLGARDIHVWRADLVNHRRHNAFFSMLLDEGEQSRAQRYMREHDRSRFVTAHGILRILLGRYLAIEPRSIAFMSGPYGKPALVPGLSSLALRFNISHSHDVALFAFANGREVGVDIEHKRPLGDMEQIARRFFSPQETASLLSLPSDARPRAFYACWSRKEAFIKATGHGLSLSLASFDVSLLPDEPVALLATRDDACATAPWTLHALPEVPGYAAALAVEGNVEVLECWHYEHTSG